mmetsp:Transcript_176895/g.567343  ORF Transcript_176895/g.567343 Transcript_176895/m.567343 type:complete len:229 (-) Transcript_176895:103-789(-)
MLLRQLRGHRFQLLGQLGRKLAGRQDRVVGFDDGIRFAHEAVRHLQAGVEHPVLEVASARPVLELLLVGARAVDEQLVVEVAEAGLVQPLRLRGQALLKFFDLLLGALLALGLLLVHVLDARLQVGEHVLQRIVLRHQRFGSVLGHRRVLREGLHRWCRLLSRRGVLRRRRLLLDGLCGQVQDLPTHDGELRHQARLLCTVGSLNIHCLRRVPFGLERVRANNEQSGE